MEAKSDMDASGQWQYVINDCGLEIVGYEPTCSKPSYRSQAGYTNTKAFSSIDVDVVRHLTRTKPIDGKPIDFKGFADYRLCLCIVNPPAVSVLTGKQPQFRTTSNDKPFSVALYRF